MSDPALDVKIGQMLLLGFHGATVGRNSPILRDIRQRHIGGVVLFDDDVARQSPIRNIHSPQQVTELTAALQAAADIPLLVAIDQEGGYVNRLKTEYGFPPGVSAQVLGAADDVENTRHHAATVARTLSAIGINLNLAPVVDLNINPDNPAIGGVERSFSADPAVVTRHARAWIDAHHTHNVLTCLKHFPGHGSACGDTHAGFVDVTDTWTEAELEPFANLIRSGHCDAVMTAHIVNTTLDPARPATLSHVVITDLLREQLGYDGVVISDDMGMRAIIDQYDFESAVRGAIAAGVDIIALGNNARTARGNIADAAARGAECVRRLIDAGIFTAERIDRSYRRILALKQRLGMIR